MLSSSELVVEVRSLVHPARDPSTNECNEEEESNDISDLIRS